jgi:hypothetical protein
LHALSKAISSTRELVARAHQSANPIEELKKTAQPAFPVQQLIARTRQRLAVFLGKLDDLVRIETTFKMNMNFSLEQHREALDHSPIHSQTRHCDPWPGSAIPMPITGAS